MNNPKYTQTYKYTHNTTTHEQNRINKTKKKINKHLNNHTPTINTTYQINLTSITQHTTDNIITLTRTYILCINELNKNPDTNNLNTVKLFQDLTNIEPLYYDYRNNPNPYTKNQIQKLITPYIPEIKHLIIKCKEMFKDEEDILKELLNKI